jgi:hypothetical protein
VNRADQAVRLLALAVGPTRRARFVEEWRSDLAAARATGLAPAEVLAAAARVAGFLLWIRVRPLVLRERRRRELVAAGVLLGLVLVVADVRIDVAVPFVLLAIGWWLVGAVRRWIDGGR